MNLAGRTCAPANAFQGLGLGPAELENLLVLAVVTFGREQTDDVDCWYKRSTRQFVQEDWRGRSKSRQK